MLPVTDPTWPRAVGKPHHRLEPKKTFSLYAYFSQRKLQNTSCHSWSQLRLCLHTGLSVKPSLSPLLFPSSIHGKWDSTVPATAHHAPSRLHSILSTWPQQLLSRGTRDKLACFLGKVAKLRVMSSCKAPNTNLQIVFPEKPGHTNPVDSPQEFLLLSLS